jgi:ZIP family zinc transporter
MPGWLQAALWGSLAGGALLLGALVGYRVRVPQRLIAAIMGFGSGVLISAVAFELMDEALRTGGLLPTAFGFAGGAVAFTGANLLLERAGARHRKRSQAQQPSESEQEGSGLAIAVGALLDGVPESIVIGLSLLAGQSVSIATVAAVFLSNVPEGLSSAAGMKQAGRGAAYVFGVWGGIALACGVAAAVGYLAFRAVPPAGVALTMAIAAGAMLAMLVDTMLPEAFAHTHTYAGLITVLGFLAAFALSRAL